MTLINDSMSPWNLLMPLSSSVTHARFLIVWVQWHMFVPLVWLITVWSRQRGDRHRWTLIVFYSKWLSSGTAPTFLSPPNGRWCVVFAADLCVGGAAWFTELWHCLSSWTRAADSGSLCVFQVSQRSGHQCCTHTRTCTNVCACTCVCAAYCIRSHICALLLLQVHLKCSRMSGHVSLSYSWSTYCIVTVKQPLN